MTDAEARAAALASQKIGWRDRVARMFAQKAKELKQAIQERDMAAKLERQEAERLLKRRIHDLDLTQFWLNVKVEELYTWSLRELRWACAQRGLSQEGLKPVLVDRLMQAAWADRKVVERDRMMRALQDQREGEAAGTVYCVGLGYGAEYQSPDRPFVRDTLTVMSKLSGRGVHTVTAGFDSTICYAICENGDVWVWGEVRPDERAPVGFQRPLAFEGVLKDRLKVYRTDYKFQRPPLAGNDMVGEAPKPVRHLRHLPRRPRQPRDVTITWKENDETVEESDSDEEVQRHKQRIKVIQEVLSEMHDPYFVSPVVISRLRGEGIVELAPSRTHCLALSDGGDVFVWGAADSGMLGLGAEAEYQEVPVLLKDAIDKPVHRVAVGTMFSAAVTTIGELYLWGSPAQGSCGFGPLRRFGPQPKALNGIRYGIGSDQKMECISQPMVLSRFQILRQPVRQIACGAQHTLAMTPSGVWAWGCGDGGRLGLGDIQNRNEPTIIPELADRIVVFIAAGVWHSACIVQTPPQSVGGAVFTWGSGYSGQLGQGPGVQTCLTPQPIRKFVDKNIIISFVSCGAHHCAALSVDGDVYTWGADFGNCLGRPHSRAAQAMPGIYDSEPGRMESLREYGIGEIISVTCGNKFTALATLPYSQLPAYRVRELARLDIVREEHVKRAADLKADAARRAKAAAAKSNKPQEISVEQKMHVDELNATQPLCSRCSECPGFTPSLFKPMACDHCGHDRKVHNRMRVAGNAKYALQTEKPAEEDEDAGGDNDGAY